MKLSVIIITKNSESLIRDCLESVTFCDEIILVDNFSTDRSVEIAKEYKAKVINSDTHSFAERRNIGLKAAKGDWILYIDVDERVTKKLQESIEDVIKNVQSGFAGYRIKRKNFYLGNHKWPFVEKLERVFKKEKLQYWHGDLHESPVVNGEIGEFDGFLLHYTHRDLESMLDKTIEWSDIEAMLRYNAHHPTMTWWRFPRVMTSAFLDLYITQGGWKIGTAGFIESVYQAFSMFITYAKLWELQKKKSSV